MSYLSEMGRWVLSTVWPEFCLGCGKRYELLCAVCWPRVDFVYEQICPVCGEASVGGLRHPKCGSKDSLDGLWCLTWYRGPVSALIQQLKYSYTTVLIELIEQLFSKYIEHENIWLAPSIIVPVPLHKRSEMKRGFNQSRLIAGQLEKAMGYPVVDGVVVRVRNTQTQTRLNKEERRRNVEGCFVVDVDREAIEGQTFIVVDDVFTSGATMGEVARVLKKAGASRVYGFALARD